eukprot:Pgem_evm1s15914
MPYSLRFTILLFSGQIFMCAYALDQFISLLIFYFFKPEVDAEPPHSSSSTGLPVFRKKFEPREAIPSTKHSTQYRNDEERTQNLSFLIGFP